MLSVSAAISKLTIFLCFVIAKPHQKTWKLGEVGHREGSVVRAQTCVRSARKVGIKIVSDKEVFRFILRPYIVSVNIQYTLAINSIYSNFRIISRILLINGI